MSIAPLRRWIVPSRVSPPATDGVSPLVAAILASRGVGDPLGYLLPPPPADAPLPLDLAKAAARLRDAIEKREPIAVYGDYDVDGIAGTAILVRALHALEAPDVRTYIPNRYEEGYGLNATALANLAAQGARVVVSVDCGVTAVEEARVARELGLDLVITDHHHPPAALPEAFALVNPRRPGDPSPDKDLSGAGVAFLVAREVLGDRFDAVASVALQLAALATVADVVPLRGANRWLVREGLAEMNRAPLVGLGALAKRAGVRIGGIEAHHIGFVIGPRLNAAGRLADAEDALRLLLTDDEAEATALADSLELRNQERQRLTREVVAAAREKALLAGEAPMLLVYDAAWPAGIVGLAASRLVEEFGRPAAVVAVDGAEGKGSCRSIAEVHIAEVLATCGDLLLRHGGHAMAAGFSVRVENLVPLADRLGRAVLAAVGGALPEPTLRVDLDVSPEELIAPETIRALRQLEPTGASNPRPLFLLRGARIFDVRLAGEDHLRCKVRVGRWTVDAVAFGRGDAVERAQQEPQLDLVVALGSGMFGGDRGGVLQLELRDFASSERAGTMR